MDARAGALIRPKRRFLIIPNPFTAAHCLDRYREGPRAQGTPVFVDTLPLSPSRARAGVPNHTQLQEGVPTQRWASLVSDSLRLPIRGKGGSSAD